MTPLRQRMIQDLQLKGYSESTQQLYVSAVRQLCDHFDKPPGRITEEDLRDYFLHGKNVRKWKRSTSTVALCGIKFFYENTIKRPWPTLLFIRPGHEKKLPVVLSRDEVRQLLSNIELLREQWKTHRNKVWIFPSAGNRGTNMPDAAKPLSNSSVQAAFRSALRKVPVSTKKRRCIL